MNKTLQPSNTDDVVFPELSSDMVAEYFDWFPPEWIRTRDESSKETKPELQAALRPVEEKYLRFVIDNQQKGMSSSEIAEALGLSSGTALKIRRKLAKEGHIIERELNRSRRGRPAICVEPRIGAFKLLGIESG